MHSRPRQAKSNAYEIADYIASNSGIQTLLKEDKSPEGQGKTGKYHITCWMVFRSLCRMMSWKSGEEGSTDRSLSAYLQTISLMTDADQKEENPDNVTLMSVHSAKGLGISDLCL
jgi:DNA helicase-2/ATP-dependent DNA helicase PcrA